MRPSHVPSLPCSLAPFIPPLLPRSLHPSRILSVSVSLCRCLRHCLTFLVCLCVCMYVYVCLFICICLSCDSANESMGDTKLKPSLNGLSYIAEGVTSRPLSALDQSTPYTWNDIPLSLTSGTKVVSLFTASDSNCFRYPDGH